MTAAAPLPFPPVLATLLAGGSLTPADVRAAFDAILEGAWTPIQVGAFAVALRMRGETAEVIVAAAQAMRARMTAVEHGLPCVVDTCGTGGDGAHTLNLSSAAALVVAAAGVPVAKHGNRSVSSRCGSADVLEALGIPVDLDPSRQATVLREANIAFLFAPAHHPALRHAGEARKQLGTRTIFNALGPLANPARATHQLAGVYDDALRPIAARALGALGVQRAWVVRGEDGLDEVSPCAPTRVSSLDEHGEVREAVITPEDFGLPYTDRESIAGGDTSSNAEALTAIIAGTPHRATNAVLLNAAAMLHVAEGDDKKACALRAREALLGGHARERLEMWRASVRKARGA